LVIFGITTISDLVLINKTGLVINIKKREKAKRKKRVPKETDVL